MEFFGTPHAGSLVAGVDVDKGSEGVDGMCVYVYIAVRVRMYVHTYVCVFVCEMCTYVFCNVHSLCSSHIALHRRESSE